jgi:hypothetical protein
MTPQKPALTVLFLLILVVSTACLDETVRVTPAPSSAAPTTAAPTTAAPTRTAPATPTPPPTVTAIPVPTTSPGSTPSAACAPLTGGSTANRAILTDVRVAHNPGFDRLVFEFAPSTGPGAYGVPPYRIEIASTFTAVSGQQVRVDGNAFFAVNFQQADAHDPNTGKQSLSNAKLDQKPGTPLIREVKLVEDFEATVRWAVGLDRQVCPSVLTLASPVRVVLDYPTPP